MRILHYSLGLPPYRSGGLTKYCTDLMVEQAKSENDILLMFPGRMGFTNNDNIKIKFYREYKKIKVYELLNPLPVPILNGIANPKIFSKACDKQVFIDFLTKLNVDIVHIHTFMGLYKEFIEACKVLGIKIIFTSHDYFGLCPKVNFINYKGKLCQNIDFGKCVKCNSTGDSIKKIKVLQSKSYRYIKDKGVIDKLKKYLNLNNNNKLTEEKSSYTESIHDKDSYIALNKYYYSMFKDIDKIFFNSQLAKNIYDSYINTDGYVIPITHSGIKDNRKLKKYNERDVLKLTYLGPYKEYKGFNLLCDVMRQLEIEGYEKIVLNTYGDTNINFKISKNIKKNEKYSYSDLGIIFKNTDVLVVPSIWNETFGFITLEALSYGVPVLVSNKVGSKDLICFDEYVKGDIIEPSINEIKNRILELYNDRTILQTYNNNIVNSNFGYSLEKHSTYIYGEYKTLLEE